MTEYAAHGITFMDKSARDVYGELGADELRKHAESPMAYLASVARSEIQSGFPKLRAHAIAGLWGALEYCVDSICAEWLQFSTESGLPESLARIKVALGEVVSLDDDARWAWMIEQVKRNRGSDVKKSVGQFESVLNSVGLDGSIEGDVRIVLHYSKAIRNIVAHNGGRADKVFIENCPRIEAAPGELLAISKQQFAAIIAAIVFYAETISVRTVAKARGTTQAPVSLPPWIASTAELHSMMFTGDGAIDLN